MNKSNVLVLSFIVLFAVCACSKFGSNDKTKSTTASPFVAEKSAENTNQTNKSDNSPSVGEIADLERAAQTNPKDFAAQFQLAKKYQSSKMEEKAVGAYKQAIELKPDSHEANYEIGKIYLNKKDFQTSLPFLQKAARIKDTSAVYLIALGDNLRELKRCNDAIPPYGNSINYDDKNAAAYYGMGCAISNSTTGSRRTRKFVRSKNSTKIWQNSWKQRSNKRSNQYLDYIFRMVFRRSYTLC